MRGGFLFFPLGNPRVFPRISRQVMGHQHWSQYELLWIHLGLYWHVSSLISSQEGPWVGPGRWLFTGKVEKDVVPGLKQGRGRSQGDGDRDLTGPATPQKEEQPERHKPGRRERALLQASPPSPGRWDPWVLLCWVTSSPAVGTKQAHTHE